MSQAKKKARESDPKIKSLGWEDLEPGDLIDRTIERVRKASAEAKRLADLPVRDRDPVVG